jgi:hypothetical protein
VNRARLAVVPLLLAAAVLLPDQASIAAERPSVDGWPGFAVGRVNIRGGGFCTATLIGEHRAVTAARCLRDGASAWYGVDRIVVELAPHRATRKGHAPVTAFQPAPGLVFLADGRPEDPARDWAVLDLGEASPRDPRVQPVGLASPAERATLRPGSQLGLVAYTSQRPYVATLADGCRVQEVRGQPQVVLHDCAASASVAGAAVLAETGEGTVLVGIQVGTGALDGKPVGVAALLERRIEPAALLGSATGP